MKSFYIDYFGIVQEFLRDTGQPSRKKNNLWKRQFTPLEKVDPFHMCDLQVGSICTIIASLQPKIAPDRSCNKSPFFR